MDTLQILCTLYDVKNFLGVFLSDLLPHSITQPGTIIVSCDPHTEDGLYKLGINFQPKSFSGFYFDSYGLYSYIPSIRSFLKRTCSLWDFNTTQPQVLNSSVCGKYCCLFALYLDRGYSPKQFVSLFDPRTADKQVAQMFTSEFGFSSKKGLRCVQCCN